MFVLTTQERLVVLFVVGVWLTGVGVRLVVEAYPRAAYFISGEELKLPLNTASFEEMVASRCVSEKLAAKIVADRQQNGPFQTLDALLRVKGIGPHRLRKLKAVFCIDAP